MTTIQQSKKNKWNANSHVKTSFTWMSKRRFRYKFEKWNKDNEVNDTEKGTRDELKQHWSHYKLVNIEQTIMNTQTSVRMINRHVKQPYLQIFSRCSIFYVRTSCYRWTFIIISAIFNKCIILAGIWTVSSIIISGLKNGRYQ
jgi:hypothetical protein